MNSIIKINELEFVKSQNDHYISGVEICRKLGYASPTDQAAIIWSRHKKDLESDSATIKLIATDGKHYDTRCYNQAGALFFITKCNTPIANEITKKVIEAFLILSGSYNQLNLPISNQVEDCLRMAELQSSFFQMDTTAKLLWGQNLLHRYNLPVPDRIPLLENKIITKLYQLKEIYSLFNATGRGSKPKKDNIKSILSEFETDSKYAVNVPYCRNGHTGTCYQYTEKMIEKLEEILKLKANK